MTTYNQLAVAARVVLMEAAKNPPAQGFGGELASALARLTECVDDLEEVGLKIIDAPFMLMDAHQLQWAAEFAAPDYEKDEDQRSTELCFQYLPERESSEGEKMSKGLYCWYADYPEEGVMHLETYEEAKANSHLDKQEPAP